MTSSKTRRNKFIAILLTIAMVPALLPGISWAQTARESDGKAQVQAPEPADPGDAETGEEPEDPGDAETGEKPAEEAEMEKSGEDSPEESVKEETEGPKDSREETETAEASGQEREAGSSGSAKAADKSDSVKYPAASFTESAGRMTVRIRAPKGALPEGAKVRVTALDRPKALAIADHGISDERKVKDVRAVDITFYNREGKEIEPKQKVTVTFLNADMKGEHPEVYHEVSDGGAVVKVKALSSCQGGSFRAKDFSVYLMVTTEDSVMATYEFYAGEERVRTQTVTEGEDLYEPAPPVSREGAFTGWYIEGSDTPILFSDGKWKVPDSRRTGTVKVLAGFTEVYYATFRDSEGGVLSRIPVSRGGRIEAEAIPAFAPKEANQSLAGWAESENAGTDQSVVFPYTMTGDTTFYPVIETGFWIHFDANRSHIPGMENVNVSYTAPVFVRQGERTAAPRDPVAQTSAYTFDGWYTDSRCSSEFQFGDTLKEDTRLYADWKTGRAKYNVVIWQQKVTDDKNAEGAARGWDYVTSYEKEAAVGSTVRFSDLDPEIRSLSFDGFTRDHTDTSITVAGDGSSTFNLYYRRNIVEIRFFVAKEADGSWNFDKSTVRSSGRTQNNPQEWRSITGLYGQSFSEAGRHVSDAERPAYIWPGQYRWYDGEIYQTLVATFTSGDRYYCMGSNGDRTVYHVKQNTNGTWPSEAQVKKGDGLFADAAGFSGGNHFLITDKYDTFTAVAYSTRDYYPTEEGRTEAIPGSTEVAETAGDPLYVYHARKSYAIEFFDGSEKVDSASEVYEAGLTRYASRNLTARENAGRTFGGWSAEPNVHDAGKAIDWSRMRMPARTLRVFAIWVDIGCNVQLDPGAEDAVMDPGQSLNFRPGYGEAIEGSCMNRVVRSGYSLIGWFDADGNPWNFENPVTKEGCDEGPLYDESTGGVYYVLHLTAKWQRNMEFRVDYDENGGRGNFTDPEIYARNASVAVLSDAPAPPREDLSFLGWTDALGRLHLPGSSFTVDEEGLITTRDGRNLVRLTAQYSAMGVPKAQIIYHDSNSGAALTDDNHGKYYDWNEAAKAYGPDAFTRKGYLLRGWHEDRSAAEAGIVQIPAGADVYASAMHTSIDAETRIGSNDLYAVWEKKPDDAGAGETIDRPEDSAAKDPVDPDPKGGDASAPAEAPSPGQTSVTGNVVPRAAGSGTAVAAASLREDSLITDHDAAPEKNLQNLADDATPGSIFDGTWALLNLIFMVATSVISILLLALYIIRKKDDKDEGDEQRSLNKLIVRLLGVIPAVTSVITFFMVEDLTMEMDQVDRYTSLMLFILGVEVLVAFIAKGQTDAEERKRKRSRYFFSLMESLPSRSWESLL